MRHTRRAFAIGTLVAAVAGLLAAPTAHAQPNRGNDIDPNPQPVILAGGGTDLLRAFLDKAGIEPVRANNMWTGDDLIVIVIGSTQPQQWDKKPLDWVRQAIGAGGAALIATDQGCNLHENGRNPNWDNSIASISWSNVTAAGRDCHQPPNQFNELTSTPFAVPVSPDEMVRNGEKPGPVWSLFRGLNRVATNQPSFIDNLNEFRGEYQYPLARLPKSSLIDGWRQPNKQLLLAVGGDGEARWGRRGHSFLAVADSSVYINQMVMEEGTQNFEFMQRTIEYLQGPDPNKKRKRCLFFENGRVIDKFDGLRNAFAKPRPPIPPEQVPNLGALFGKNQDKVFKFLDEKADELQQKDFLHNVAVGAKGSARERRNYGDWLEVVLVLSAIVVTLLLLRRSTSARQPMDVPPAPNTGAGQASTGPPGVFDRRQKELVRRNNLYEPVRNLMREFFATTGAPPNPGPKIPRLVIDRSIRKPDSLRQAVRDMWRIAFGPPMHISAQRWFELEPYFERLRKAHDDGKWRFETGE